MAPISSFVSLALFLSLGSAAVRPTRIRTGINDPPDFTDSPDNNNFPSVTNALTNNNLPSVTNALTNNFPTSLATGRGATTPGITSARTSRTDGQTPCPTDQASYFWDRTNYCCPGDFYGLGNNAICGVSCTATSTGFGLTQLSDQTCTSTIPITENDYNSKVAAATGGSSGSGTSTSPGAAAMITAGPMVGAIAVAGAVLLGL